MPMWSCSRAADDVRDEARSLLELDEADEHGIVEAVDLWEVRRGPQVQRRPRPTATMKVVSKLPHSAQRGDGGKRNTPQSVHFWMRSSSTHAPSPEVLVVAVDRRAGAGASPDRGHASVARRRPRRSARCRGDWSSGTGPSRRPRRRPGTSAGPITKCPTPRPVCFSSLNVLFQRPRVLCTHSPGTSEPSELNSELTATVEVKPCASRRSRRALRVVGVALLVEARLLPDVEHRQ